MKVVDDCKRLNIRLIRDPFNPGNKIKLCYIIVQNQYTLCMFCSRSLPFLLEHSSRIHNSMTEKVNTFGYRFLIFFSKQSKKLGMANERNSYGNIKQLFKIEHMHTTLGLNPFCWRWPS